MPILVKPNASDLARLKAAQASAEYVGQNLDKLRGMRKPYLVLHGQDIVGRGDTPEAAWQDAEKAGAPRSECILIRVPRQDEAYFF